MLGTEIVKKTSQIPLPKYPRIIQLVIVVYIYLLKIKSYCITVEDIQQNADYYKAPFFVLGDFRSYRSVVITNMTPDTFVYEMYWL